MLNFVSVCVDAYPMIYAEKLHSRVDKLSNLDMQHYCITDRPRELPSGIIPIQPFVKSKGWWNKLNLFSTQMPQGNILYLDLDIVVLENFDEEILYMLSRDEQICCVSDAINWMGSKFSSSLMCFKAGALSEIFKNFYENESEINETPGGDQVWTAPQLSSVFYVDEKFPNLKKNFKFQLCELHEGKLKVPLKLSEKIKMIDCGGYPKPHQLATLPYINQNWHQI